MDVYVGCAVAEGLDEIVVLAGGQALGCWADDVGGLDCAGDCRRCGGACLGARWAVAQVGAEEDADAAALCSAAEVDVGLQDIALKLGVAELIGDLLLVVVDPARNWPEPFVEIGAGSSS